MKDHFEQLYASLQKDLNACKEKFPGLQKQIEQCFIICNHYWAIVRHDAAEYEFENLADEILFFKQLKPKFTTLVEYYSLWYHAHLYKSEVYDPVKIKQFLLRESARLEKFISEHRSFYEYYKKGRTDKDIWFFTRNISDKSAGLDARAVSTYDPLIAKLLALEKYNEYVQAELAEY